MKNDNISCQLPGGRWNNITKVFFVSDFIYIEGDRAIHFKPRTRGVLYNGQFSGTLLGISRGREGDEPVFGQVERLQVSLLIFRFVQCQNY